MPTPTRRSKIISFLFLVCFTLFSLCLAVGQHAVWTRTLGVAWSFLGLSFIYEKLFPDTQKRRVKND